MSAPPRAKNEYSRATGVSEGAPGQHDSRLSGSSGRVKPPPWGPVGAWLFASALAGALLLFVAEFTTLYTERIGTFHGPSTVVRTGQHDSYAMVPIAVLAIILAAAVLRVGSRPALLAVGIAGVVALLIALLGDLPDAHSAGLITGPSGQFVSAVRDPGAGIYLETLGAVLLIATSGLGFLLIGRPGPPQPRRRPRVAEGSEASPGRGADAAGTATLEVGAEAPGTATRAGGADSPATPSDSPATPSDPPATPSDTPENRQ